MRSKKDDSQDSTGEFKTISQRCARDIEGALDWVQNKGVKADPSSCFTSANNLN